MLMLLRKAIGRRLLKQKGGVRNMDVCRDGYRPCESFDFSRSNCL